MTGELGHTGVEPIQGTNSAVQLTSKGTSVIIECYGSTIIEVWQERSQMPTEGDVGRLGFAEGISYIMTKQGWVNTEEALSPTEPITDRRGAIRAQKERNA
jgi:hypothetical protein